MFEGLLGPRSRPPRHFPAGTGNRRPSRRSVLVLAGSTAAAACALVVTTLATAAFATSDEAPVVMFTAAGNGAMVMEAVPHNTKKSSHPGGPPTSSPPASPSITITQPASETTPSEAAGQPTVVPVRTSTRVSAVSVAVASATDTAEPVATRPVTFARPVIGALGVGDGANSNGLRLLAVIATICVLGVTAAIIRAIVRLAA